MKSIALFLLSCFAALSAYGFQTDELDIYISSVRSEHSRDSNSTSTTITIKGKTLVFDQKSGGRGRRAPVHKEYRLTNQEIAQLRKLIAEKNLLVSGSSAYPVGQGPYTSYDLNVKIGFKGRRSAIQVSGPANSGEMKDDKLYKSASALLAEVLAIIHSRDEEATR